MLCCPDYSSHEIKTIYHVVFLQFSNFICYPLTRQIV